MKLAAVILENFRGYSQRTRIEIAELTAFIGKNDAGKLEMYETTNILLNGNGKIMYNKEDLLEYKGKNLEIIWNGIIVKVKIESISKLI